MATAWEQHYNHAVLRKVLSSKNTTEMDDMTSRLLTGHVTSHDLPSVSSRLVRVFLCTTGVDSVTERTAFVEQVYPKLREYCQELYCMEFHMIDLCWGVSTDQMQRNGDWVRLKLQEIQKCYTMSCGPCFVAFIGQNYGDRHLPASILAEDYQVIKSALLSERRRSRGRDALGVDHLDMFYVIDDNSVPPVYLLKTDDVMLDPNHKEDNVRQLAEEQWKDQQRELNSLLQKGVRLAFTNGTLDGAGKDRFFMSDFEREVLLGTEQDGADGSFGEGSGCGWWSLVVQRDVVDVHNHLEHPRAPRFVQMTLVPVDDDIVVDDQAHPESVTHSAKKNGGNGGEVSFGETMSTAAPRPVCLMGWNQSDPRMMKLQMKLLQQLQEVQGEEVVVELGDISASSQSLHLHEESSSHLMIAEAQTCPKCLKRVMEIDPPPEEKIPPSMVYAVDEEAWEQLKVMKDRVKDIVPKVNMLSYEVLWKYEEVIDPDLHSNYLKTLCADLLESLQRLIDEAACCMEDPPQLVPEAQESLQHWIHCHSLTSDVSPCHEQLCHQLRDYVTGASLQGPLVIFGVSGCGKTKLVSDLARELPELLGEDQSLCCAIRYMGLTDASCGVLPVLSGLCRQLCCVLGHDPDTVPHSRHHLRIFLQGLLSAMPAYLTVVFILDGVEKLLQEADTQLWHWLPTALPENVKIIVTLTPDLPEYPLPESIVEDLADRYHVLELGAMGVSEAEQLLNQFLAHVDRQISDSQMELFRERFQTCSSPLYVKLLVNQARALKSFTDVSNITLPKDTAEALNCFFDKLEADHGAVIVSRVLAYLSASPSGLSDAEMEDLLSLDDAVLFEVYDHHFHHQQHAIRRVPGAVWLKIRKDLEPFLLLRQVDGGVTVTVWEHSCLERAVRRRYFQQPDDVSAVHALLADYFLGTWAGKAKAVVRPGAEEDVCIPPCGLKADRLVPQQPHMFGSWETTGTQPRLNQRMYNQLPRHLSLCGRETELKELVLFNYAWIFNKIHQVSLYRCLQDYLLSPGQETGLVRTALAEASRVLEADPLNIGMELTGRLLSQSYTQPWIRTLLASCDLEGISHCALLPGFPYRQIPDSPLEGTLLLDFIPDDLTLAHNHRYLVCKKRDLCPVLVWDLQTCQLSDVINTSQGQLYVTPDASYFVIGEMDRSFKIHEAGTGALMGQVIPLNDVAHGVRKVGPQVGPISVGLHRLHIVLNSCLGAWLGVYEIPSAQCLQTLTLDLQATACHVTPCEQRVLISAGQRLLVYDISTMTLMKSVSLSDKIQDLALTEDGHWAVMTFLPNKMMVANLNSSGDTLLTLPVPAKDTLLGDVIKGLRVAPDHRHVLLRTDSHVVVYEILPNKAWAEGEDGNPFLQDFEGKVAVRQACHVVRPAELPTEFRLLGSHYTGVVYMAAEFSSDTQHVFAAIFRHVYVHSVTNGELLHTLQNPIGLTTTLLVARTSNHIVAHNLRSNRVMVWRHVTSDCSALSLPQQDTLTRPVTRVLMTSDQRLVFAQCDRSDQIGVFDMRTGLLVDLLTHAGEVKDMAITSSGEIILVIVKARLSNMACQLWYLPERKVIKEWGDGALYCFSLHTSPTLLLLTQTPPFPSPLFPLSPSSSSATLTVLRFQNGSSEFVQKDYPEVCPVVRSRPVATHDDRFLVISSALDWNPRKGLVTRPCLVLLDLSLLGQDQPPGVETPHPERTILEASTVCMEHLLLDILQLEVGRDRRVSTLVVAVSLRPATAAVALKRGWSQDDDEGAGDADGEGAGDADGEGADGEGAGDADGEGAGDADGEGAGDADGEGAGDADGEGAGDADGEGAGDADGEGAGDADGEGAGHADGEGAGHADGEGVGDKDHDAAAIRVADDIAAAAVEVEDDMQNVALMTLDLTQAALTSFRHLPFPFRIPPSFLSSPPRPPLLLFSFDLSLCVDPDFTLYSLYELQPQDDEQPEAEDQDLHSGHEDLPDLRGASPQCLALHGSAVVYFKGCWLFVLRLMDARLIARCHVHGVICHVTLCPDQRTLVVGCLDGQLTSYVIVDPSLDPDPGAVVRGIPSRQMPVKEMMVVEEDEWQRRGKGDEKEPEEVPQRKWDRVEVTSAPAYSRPPSEMPSTENKDKKTLQDIMPQYRGSNRWQMASILSPIPCKCWRLWKNPQGQIVKCVKGKRMQLGFCRK